MVPIMFDIFTLIIIKNNQDIGNENRLNDLDIARQQRSYMLGNETVFEKYR